MERKNKLMLIAAIGAVVVLIASSAVRCTIARQSDPGTAAEQQQSQQAEEAPEAQAGNAGAMDILRSHVWQAEGDPKDTCTFKEGSFVESKDGKLSATPFTAGDETASESQTTLTITPLREDSSDGERATIIIDGKEGSYTVTCDAFQLHKTYVQGKAPDVEFSVTGIADETGGLGSDAAIEAADIVIMTDEPSKLALAIRIARFTRNIVRQNVVFAIGIKVLVLILSALGITGMWMAVFADVGVCVLAILNSMRALR